MQDARLTLAQLVCGWSPARLGAIAAELAASNAVPAKTFPAYDSYVAYFEPLLLAELAAELYAAAEAAGELALAPLSATSAGWKSSKASIAKNGPRLVTVSRALSVRGSDGALVDVIPAGPSALPLSLYDGAVVALWDVSESPKSKGIPDSAVMAVVRHPLSRRGGARLYLQVWPGATAAVDAEDLEEGEEPKGIEKDSRNWALLPLSSMVTMRREHEALLNVKNSPLLSSVLQPSAQVTTFAPTSAELHQQTLSYAGRITGTSGLNSSQAHAVAAAAASRKGFTIVQGPPGTGKTHTILAMLNVIHVDQYQRYYNGLLESVKPPSRPAIDADAPVVDNKGGQPDFVGGRPVSSTLLGGMIGAMNRTLAQKYDGQTTAGGEHERGSGAVSRPKRPRLLVCAPSNAAVDEILTRLITNKFIDGSGSVYSPEVARIGGGDKVSSSARPLTAEWQAEAFLDQFSKDSGDVSKSKNRSGDLQSKARQKAYLANWQRVCNSYLSQLERTPKDVANRAKVVSLHEELERLYRDLRRLRVAAGGSVESPLSREVRLRKLARTYVEDAQVVFSTLSGAASAILTQSDDAGDNSGVLFDTVIMDEGSQATEPSCLIPLTLGASRCLLVGDPQQLPATVLSSGNAGLAYGQSLLDRLCRCGLNVLLLDTQYRMHPAISSFPRRYFYEGRLKDDVSVQDEHRAKLYHLDPIKPRLGPYAFLDVVEGQERRGGAGSDASIFNPHEAELAVTLYKKLKKDYPTDGVFSERGKAPGSAVGFGVVTPYKRQLRELRQAFDRAGVPSGDVEIDTVDSYQGREKDVIIFSCVRTGERRGIGFVRDVRRMNVGLTRARSSLIVLGSAAALSTGSADWAELVNDADSRGCLVRISRVSRALALDPNDSATAPVSGNPGDVVQGRPDGHIQGAPPSSKATDRSRGVRRGRGERISKKGKRKRGQVEPVASDGPANHFRNAGEVIKPPQSEEYSPEDVAIDAGTVDIRPVSHPMGATDQAVGQSRESLSNQRGPGRAEVWSFIHARLQGLSPAFLASSGVANVNRDALTQVLVDYVSNGGILDDNAVAAAALTTHQKGQYHGQHMNGMGGVGANSGMGMMSSAASPGMNMGSGMGMNMGMGMGMGSVNGIGMGMGNVNGMGTGMGGGVGAGMGLGAGMGMNMGPGMGMGIGGMSMGSGMGMAPRMGMAPGLGIGVGVGHGMGAVGNGMGNGMGHGMGNGMGNVMGNGTGMGASMGAVAGHQMNLGHNGMYQPGIHGQGSGDYVNTAVQPGVGTYGGSYGGGNMLSMSSASPDGYGGVTLNTYDASATAIGSGNNFTQPSLESEVHNESWRQGRGSGGTTRGRGRGSRGSGSGRGRGSRGGGSSSRGGRGGQGRGRGGIAKVKRGGKNNLLGGKPASGWESLF